MLVRSVETGQRIRERSLMIGLGLLPPRTWDWRPGVTIPAAAARLHLARRWIPEGDAGVAVTVDVMGQMIEHGGLHPAVRAAAEEAVAYLPHDQGAEVDAIADWILGRVDYRPDPIRSEWLQMPWWVLARIDQGERPQLDCDDLTLLALAMLESLGFPTALRVVATQPDEVLDHVAALVEIDGRLERLDLTLGFSGGAPGPEYRAMVTG